MRWLTTRWELWSAAGLCVLASTLLLALGPAALSRRLFPAPARGRELELPATSPEREAARPVADWPGQPNHRALRRAVEEAEHPVEQLGVLRRWAKSSDSPEAHKLLARIHRRLDQPEDAAREREAYRRARQRQGLQESPGRPLEGPRGEGRE